MTEYNPDHYSYLKKSHACDVVDYEFQEKMVGQATHDIVSGEPEGYESLGHFYGRIAAYYGLTPEGISEAITRSKASTLADSDNG